MNLTQPLAIARVWRVRSRCVRYAQTVGFNETAGKHFVLAGEPKTSNCIRCGDASAGGNRCAGSG